MLYLKKNKKLDFVIFLNLLFFSKYKHNVLFIIKLKYGYIHFVTELMHLYAKFLIA
jgi:hypothetical protein